MVILRFWEVDVVDELDTVGNDPADVIEMTWIRKGGMASGNS